MKRIKLPILAAALIISCGSPKKIAQKALANKDAYDIVKKEVARLEPCVEKEPVIKEGKPIIIEKVTNIDSINMLVKRISEMKISDSSKTAMISFLLKNCSSSKTVLKTDTLLKEDTRMINILKEENEKLKSSSFKESSKIKEELSKEKLNSEKRKSERNTAYLICLILVILLIVKLR